MKLVIASDIHGAADACARLMTAIETESPDRIVLLGDLLYHGPRNDLPADYAPKRVIEMLNSVADRVIAVRGNCEAEVDQMVLKFQRPAGPRRPGRPPHALPHARPRLRTCPTQQRGRLARAAAALGSGLRPHPHQGEREGREARRLGLQPWLRWYPQGRLCQLRRL